VDRATDLFTLVEKLRTVPAESVAYHASRNHFSRWLKTRTEFALAEQLRPGSPSDFETTEAMRAHLINAIEAYRRDQNRGTVVDFERDRFDGTVPFTRIGSGSMGGKARGLAFVNYLLKEHDAAERFPEVRVDVPPAVVLGTDIYDEFLDRNHLRDFAIETEDDTEIERRFLAARLPRAIQRDLAVFLQHFRTPLAVRSSSLLEDNQYQPFAGIYDTFKLANNRDDSEERLAQLVAAVKRVYASTFSTHAKAYLDATPYRLEEEKMAVVIQRMVGARHGDFYYPHFAGVARSRNFYPTPPLTSADGIAAVALGLGRTVVNGERCLRFSPRYPRHVLQASAVQDALNASQREFWALDLESDGSDASPGASSLVRLDLAHAEEHGTLQVVGSTYSPENDAIYDGLSRTGVRLVSFAPVLKHDHFPLAGILDLLLELGERGTSGPVEIEFAVNLEPEPGEPREFGFLQMRPSIPHEQLVVESDCVLGHGTRHDIHDVVFVDYHEFERAESRQAAGEVARLNAELRAEDAPYLLIGVGRWGSTDPWLGIPVGWEEISGACVIVEAGFKDLRVTPSQGTHFFQNLTSNNVGYFTVNQDAGEGFVDWDWLRGQTALRTTPSVRHVRFDAPLRVIMNGRSNAGVILKPDGAQ
jgi:hypothetical protein